MGVPKFFRYISERYPCLSELVRMHQVPDFDNLYLDMNGIVHNCSHPDDSKVNLKITEEMMFLDIFRYIEYLFQVIKPRKLFFLAIDGVAPRAKMNQQRSRRFRSAKEMVDRENAARQKGEVIEDEYRFDSNCITPGTEFMVRLHKALQYFIQRQISTDESWQKCQVILSGHDTPGEGEHKIMDYIRYMKAQPSYDPNTTHCLYGLDADLIILGCSTHESNISLLREEVKFGKQNTKSNCVENTRFFLLHLGILREYLELEFAAVRDKVPFGYNMDKIVDDWILMTFLVGNDFVPHLPNLHIQSNALPILYRAYMDVLPRLGGYMNEDGILNLGRFQMFLDRLQMEDRKMYEEQAGDCRYAVDDANCFDDVDVNETLGGDDELAALVKASADMMMDDILDGEESGEKVFQKEFDMCRRHYYVSKMHFPQDPELYQKALRKEVEAYVSAIQWILHYYYRGVASWGWYYPSHYAPFITDIRDFADFELKFEFGKPFLPFQQLLGVLPPNSIDLVPEAYRDLILNPNSELIDFYPPSFETDMNGKKQDWEALVLIPFIDENRLLTAMAKCDKGLKDTERQRNKHGAMSVYTFTEENMGTVDGILKLPSIPNCYCSHKSIALAEIRVPPNRMVFGPWPKKNSTIIHFPGFPTMKFLKYTGKLANLRVRVFEMASNNETMEVTVHQSEEERTRTAADIYAELKDKEIFVGWPHLSHALVVGVSDDKNYVGIHASLADHEVKKFSTYAKDIKDHHLKRMGIQLGPLNILIHVNLVKSREYALSNDGKLALKTEWDNVKFVYPHQTIVPNVNVYGQDATMYKSVDDVYKRDTKVFLLSTKYYGCVGKVLDTSMLAKTKRIQITIDVHPEPNLKEVMRMHHEAKLASRGSYFNLYAACSQIGISKHALNRVTGNFFVFSGKRRQINERSADKVNIGLQMRLPKENREIPGISKFTDKAWYLSADAIDIICSYLDAYPRLCDALAKPDNNIFEDDLCDDVEEAPGAHLREIHQFAAKLPHMQIRPRKMGTLYIEPNVAEAIERAVDKVKKELVFKTIKLQTKLHLLYLPKTTIKCPDPGTVFNLFDRVIVATHNMPGLQLGTKGTIVSIFSETDENPLKYENKNVTTYMYEVLFDDEVVNGNSYFGTIGQSKVRTVTEQAIINITYGRNLANNKTERESNAVPDEQPSTSTLNQKAAPENRQVKQNVVETGPSSTSAIAGESDTKEMLNHIWNALKGKVPIAVPSPNNGLPPARAAPAPTDVESEIVLTDALRKCLKIDGGSVSVRQSEVKDIPKPSPNELPPPPPAHWRVEAQIQHLSNKTRQSMPPARPPMIQPQMQPQWPVYMCPQRPPMQPQFPQFMPPRGQDPTPRMGYIPMYGMPLPRPIAAMPNVPPPRFMNMRPGMDRGGQFFQDNNYSGSVYQGHRAQQQQLSGPQALLQNTGGAFIPLQAARKIVKLKSQSLSDRAEVPNDAAKKSVAKETVVTTPNSKGGPKVVAKKTPVVNSTKVPKVVTPRLAANFSAPKGV